MLEAARALLYLPLRPPLPSPPATLTGASDDASQVGVMLEAARALLHLPLLPRAPLVFLWTGGEEPFSPVRGGELIRG